MKGKDVVMRRIRLKQTIVLSVCAACLCLGMGAGKQATRPYKISGTTVGEITAVEADGTISFNLKNAGQATHCGRYWNEGTGSLSLVSFQGESEGTFVAANGDKIYWTGLINGATLTVTATGGTGRFADGSGGFVAQLDNIHIDLDAGTLSYTFVGSGEVTY